MIEHSSRASSISHTVNAGDTPVYAVDVCKILGPLRFACVFEVIFGVGR